MIALQGPRSDRRQRRGIAAIFGAGVAALLASFPFDVEAASCGSYPKDIRAAIKKHVETLRALERETTDRLKGLDTRTFDYLAAQARAATGVTNGALLTGVRFCKDVIETETVVMRSITGTVRWIRGEHRQLEKFHLD